MAEAEGCSCSRMFSSRYMSSDSPVNERAECQVQEQNCILVNDDSFRIPPEFPGMFSPHLPLDVELCFESQLPGSTKLNLEAASITSITSAYVGSTSAFNTTEQCLCLARTGCHGDSSSSYSQDRMDHNLVIPLCQRNSLDLQATNSLEPEIKVSFDNNQNLGFCSKFFQDLYRGVPASNLFEPLQRSAEIDETAKCRPAYINFEGNECNKVSSFVFLVFYLLH